MLILYKVWFLINEALHWNDCERLKQVTKPIEKLLFAAKIS